MNQEIPKIKAVWHDHYDAGEIATWPTWIRDNIAIGNIYDNYPNDDRIMVKTSKGIVELIYNDYIVLYDDGTLEVTCLNPFA